MITEKNPGLKGKASAFLFAVLMPLLLLNSSCLRNGSHVLHDKKLNNKSTSFYAKRFAIEEKNGYSQLSIIDPWQGARDVLQTWYLVPEGEETPEGLDTAKVIFVPVHKIICMSTTHAAMISALSEEKSMCGFSGTAFLYDSLISDMSGKGLIAEIGYEDNLNKEKIIKADPDLIMIYGIGSESASYLSKLKELGIKTMFNADYLETDPLAKAEWIRVFGALYRKSSMADSIFNSVRERYLNIKTFIRQNIKCKPKVLLGMPFRDSWFISPGNSYISKLIDDAGGVYLWSHTESHVSMPLGIENVFLKAMDADFWLNTGSAATKEDISSVDSRLSGLQCFLNGNIFNNNKRINSRGGNDYWESGALFPDLILNDMAAVLHPEIFPDFDLYFYRKLK